VAIGRRHVAAAALVVVVGGGAWFAYEHLRGNATTDTLYGNVEIRQVDLAFNAEGNVLTMDRREGDVVKQGDLLATLDAGPYRDALDLATARRDAAQAQLDLLLAGTRPEQINEARANVAAAEATLARNEATFTRDADLVQRNAVSRQDFDDARMARDAARANLDQATAALTLALNGPRPQEIAAARAARDGDEASRALAEDRLGHTRLTAPSDGIVMTRIVEPGTVVLPTASVYSMAVTAETWVRAFAPEPLLGRVAPGTEVRLTSDGGGSWRGQIGYVSPMAEFTPKTVETPELRSQLVYRLRIRVENPDAAVRQGMPVTIILPAASG
jgi:HlyD family secretion protein